MQLNWFNFVFAFIINDNIKQVPQNYLNKTVINDYIIIRMSLTHSYAAHNIVMEDNT